VRHSIVVALLTALAMALLLTSQPVGIEPAAKRRVLDYTPVTGPTFNRPVGTSREQWAIVRHINNTIDATPRGATIRIAVYSFSVPGTANRLIAAHRRGVHVQMIFDDHHVFGPQRRLQRALGKNPNRGSFAIFCNKSCRGGGGNMHQKVFLFSKAGDAENVVMVGSNNMTQYNAKQQWADVYTVVDDPALYFTYVGVFDQMKQDRPQRTPYIAADVNDYEPQFYPREGTSEWDDPIMASLEKIECLGAEYGYGVETTDEYGVTQRVTEVRLSQHAWNGTRGRYLAEKVAELADEGCDVKVIFGKGDGKVVRNILARHDVPVSHGSVRGVKTHQKVMTVNGVFDGDTSAAMVWTGSHNWSNGSLRRDETILKVDSEDAYEAYNANFEDIWNNG
jgi:phosphatidylserine/phosphatidylglycerophosphate/cardiolipin synthase-like enzyme